MLGLVLALIIAFLSMFIPGLLLSFALLRKSELHTFEIAMIGLIFGLIAPATLTWLEGYLISYVHAFTFSLWLFELNALVLTIVGALLCWREGAFSDLKPYMPKGIQARISAASAGLDEVRHRLNRFSAGKQVVSKHVQEYNELRARHGSEVSSASKLSEEERAKITALHKETQERLLEGQLREERMLLQDLEASAKAEHPTSNFHKPAWWIWAILVVLMVATFYTRIQSIVTAPKFFEFDPYFDMIDAHYILTYGKQLLLDPSAWPVVVAGTNHRLQPLVPYLEAYWYSLVNTLQYHHLAFSASLMSYVGGVYPPITAALLVFVIFMLLYHEYDEKVGLIGAALTAMMPVLLSTFVAGEQLVEPIGIFTLFFFFAAYMLAIRNMKDKKLAILAGIAFASTFLGAHYYTVTAGVLVLYILAQGIIDVLRAEPLKDFYKMNIIVIATIIIFYALYAPYQATLQSNLSSVLGIPIIIAAPALALLLVAVFDYLPKLLARRKLIIKSTDFKTKLAAMIVISVILLAVLAFTKLGNPVKSYIELSTRFTTPSKPLFMTVQEYIPTGTAVCLRGRRVRGHRRRVLRRSAPDMACMHHLRNAHIRLHSVQGQQDRHLLHISRAPAHGCGFLRGQVPAPLRRGVHIALLHSDRRGNVPRLLQLLQERAEQERGARAVACARRDIPAYRILALQLRRDGHHSVRIHIRGPARASALPHPIGEGPLRHKARLLRAPACRRRPHNRRTLLHIRHLPRLCGARIHSNIQVRRKAHQGQEQPVADSALHRAGAARTGLASVRLRREQHNDQRHNRPVYLLDKPVKRMHHNVKQQ